MTSLELIVTVVMTAVGSLLQGTVGIGLTLVAGPALVAIDSDFAPGPLLAGGIVVNLRHLLVEREHADWSETRFLFVGVPFGLVAGLIILSIVSDRSLTIIIGTSVVLAATALLLNARPRRSTSLLVGGGAAIAMTTLTSALTGPPFALLYNDRSGPVFRGTSGAFLTPLTVVAFISLIAAGRFGGDELELTLAMAPGVGVGLFCARYARPYLDRSWFRPAVLLLSAAGGLALVIGNI